MRFGEDFLEELKSRTRLSDLIGRTVALKRRGHEFVGLSPFTQEKTPSFFVNDAKGFYHCFSSGQHGDMIDFLIQTERLSFTEAVERLAVEAGMPLPAMDMEPAKTAERRERHKKLFECLAVASRYFQTVLKSVEGQSARKYLEERGLKETFSNHFEIGYATASGTALREQLRKKGFSLKEMMDTGLLIQPEGGRSPYDRFRDRVIFPIRNTKGQIIGFGGRALNSNSKAKYLNSPDTELFHKGNNLYRYFEARKSLGVQNDQDMIVVEGYMDVIAMVEAGFPQTVAPLGTALTDAQLAMIWRVSSEPVLFFDGDSAGRKAAYRVIDNALPFLKPGHSLKFVLLEDGQDPDDLLRSQGKQAVQENIKNAQPLVEVLWHREITQKELNTPERKAELKQRLKNAVELIKDKEVKIQYQEELFNRFNTLFLRRRVQKGKNAPWKLYASPELKASRLHSEIPVFIRHLIAAVFFFPEMLCQVEEKFIALEISNQKWDAFRHRLYNLVLEAEKINKEDLYKQLIISGFQAQSEQLKRDYSLTLAEIGGQTASIEERQRIWINLYDHACRRQVKPEYQKRLVEEIDKGNHERLQSFMGIAKEK